MMIKFSLDSSNVANMGPKEFADKIIFDNVRSLVHLLSKNLNVNIRQVERLIPIQSKQGATFSFVIDCDPIEFDPIWESFVASINDQSLAFEVKTMFNFNDQCDIPIDTILDLRFTAKREIDIAALFLNRVGHRVPSSMGSGFRSPQSGAAKADVIRPAITMPARL